MAFSMSALSSGSGGSARVEDGGETEPIVSGQLGFKALNGEKKVRVAHAAWPEDQPPQSTSSLLGIASAKGLLVVGGPDRLLLGRTQAIRDLIYATKDDKGQAFDSDIRDYQPFHSIAHSRITHVAFSSDETCLALSEEVKGGLTVYSSADLDAGKSQAALQIATDGPLRALLPNPNPERAQLFALVTTAGDLKIADASQGQLTQGPNGHTIAQKVSCASWSNKGKQIVAGLSDGTLVQLTPEGSIKAQIPRSPSFQEGLFITSVAWLGDDVFFVAYGEGSTTQSEYYIIERDATDKANPIYKFSKLSELTFPTSETAPTIQHIARLRNYHPEELKDLLIVATSTSSDIAMVAKPAVSIQQADDSTRAIVNAFVQTQPDDDRRGASLPLGDNGDTVAVGMAIDLSELDGVMNPLPLDIEAESGIDKSPIPLPLLSVLNNEGVLSCWAVVYNNSVVQKVPYPGFAEIQRTKTVADAQDQDQMDTSARTSFAAPPQSQPASSQPNTISSPFAAAGASSTGNISSGPAFGQPGFGTGAAFAKPGSQLGGQTSWVNTGFGRNNSQPASGFGQPSFGSPAPLGGVNQTKPAQASATFGQTGFGQQGASFGKPGLMGQQSTPSFGQNSFGAQSKTGGSPFAAANPSTSSGFGAFAGKGGFGGQQTASNAPSPFAAKPSSGSVFGQSTGQTQSPFASTGTSKQNVFNQTDSSSPFGKQLSQSPFGATKSDTNKSSFGDASAFKMPSLFKSDGTAKDDLPKPTGESGFGLGGLGGLLQDSNKQVSPAISREENMDDDDDDDAVVDDSPGSASDNEKLPTQTPPATISQPKATPAPPVSGLFGQKPVSTTTPQQTQSSNNTWSFSGFASTTPKETPAPSSTLFGTKPVTETTPAAVQKSVPSKTFGAAETPLSQQKSPKIKVEDDGKDESVDISHIPEAPLPPDPTSKPDYQAGDTSASSLNSTFNEQSEPPLPPDFVPANRSAASTLKPETSELPSEGSEVSSDFAGSGEDVTHELSSNEEHSEVKSEAEDQTENVRTSPESSFGRVTDESPDASLTGGRFTKVIQDNKDVPKKLFGEVGLTGPSFPPPTRPQGSPRSPSPVRKAPPNSFFRSPERSFSAPPRPRSIIQDKKSEYQQSSLAASVSRAQQEEAERERARNLAAQQAKADAQARESQPLQDDEDELLQQELAKPPEPTQNLDPFMMIQPGTKLEASEHSQPDIPSQIEKLYQDINSMVVTLGINARSLSAFMLYHQGQEPNENWPQVLESETPMDALNDEWVLGDITRLHEGQTTLNQVLSELQLHDAAQKLEDCYELLSIDIAELKTKVIALRKSTAARTQPDSDMQTPLSAEQLSIQHDLRKASAFTQTKLAQVEEEVAVLKAKLAEIEPETQSNNRKGFFGVQRAQKKPTVEAVINTVHKMTSMAEKKSADIDVLEAQLKKLDSSLGTSMQGQQTQTPNQRRILPASVTPKSGASSIYHTPNSRGAKSARSTPGRGGQALLISTEDREKYRAKHRKRAEVAAALKSVLQEKHTKERSGSMASTIV